MRQALDAAHPHALTVTCPAGFEAGRTLFVTTPAGEELEIVVPEGVESDEEFDVDMADVSDEEAAAPAPVPAPAPAPAPAPPTHGPLRLQRPVDSTLADCLSLGRLPSLDLERRGADRRGKDWQPRRSQAADGDLPARLRRGPRVSSKHRNAALRSGSSWY